MKGVDERWLRVSCPTSVLDLIHSLGVSVVWGWRWCRRRWGGGDEFHVAGETPPSFLDESVEPV